MLRRTIVLTAIVGFWFVAPGKAQAPQAESVAVRIVKYDELGESIRQLKGQVVVVDFWADFCIPCKREFPKLVALHEKFAKTGLAAMSVSLDDPAEAAERVKKFLVGQKSTCSNFILNEKPGTWQAKLKIDGPPCVYLFNRQGQLEQKFTDKDLDYAAIEKLVAELIQK